ncbi:hypothetical protein [Streptomyces sp. OspMP-M43]|uniref:DUF6197 family protein n=1 Tax=Streptomyces sp. OspMP-M43 TaxID=1839781 RepID=UPI00081B2D42|nr:hypothetical protein [Streptomyces sp. OspMP-M43]SCE40307.1 hypothetical protein GA0115261_105044 [Streptomyces sp. OspMP-M43]
MLLTPAPPQPTATSPVPSSELSLEARLAATEAAMTIRLEAAAVAHEVRTAHIPTEPLHRDDGMALPLTPPPAPYPTPVAALLQRAHHRLLTGGWCTGALVDQDGSHCMLGAIRAEARGDGGLAASAAAVLLDAIRRQFGDVDSVPSFNDAFADARIPLRMLDQAASLADAHGL